MVCLEDFFQYSPTLRGDPFDLALNGCCVRGADLHFLGLLLKVRLRDPPESHRPEERTESRSSIFGSMTAARMSGI